MLIIPVKQTKSKRIQFDNMVRSTNYTKDNVKIEPIVARIKDSFTTFKLENSDG